MCSTENQEIIDQVLKTFIDQGRAFTAFEVSLEAKSKGATERHRDMKGYIHSSEVITDNMEFGDYIQTLVRVGEEHGQDLKAFLYHPKSFDPVTYNPLIRGGQFAKGSQVVVVPPVANITGPTTTTTASPSSDSYVFDSRDRLLIPTSYMRKVGFEPGKTAYIYQEGTAVAVATEGPDGVSAKEQKVERDGDIRLARSTLEQNGLTASSFVIEVVDDIVLVKADLGDVDLDQQLA